MGDYLVKTVILLAACNGERFLPALMDSLAAQADGDFRVLYQDDGSTDGTAALLEARRAADPRFIPGKEQGLHLGAAGNFISLLRQADADRILLCDQDDFWEPEKVGALKAAMADAEAAFGADTPLLVHSDCSLMSEEGQPLGPSFFHHQGWDPAAVTLPKLLVQNNATGCTMVLNRPLALLVARCARPETMFMHDWFIAMTAAACGRVVFLDRPLTRYRQHEGNAIGASKHSLFRRGFDALRDREAVHARIRLTYTNAEAFLESCGDLLPPASAALVRDYLATRSLPKLRRIRRVRQLGCVMQSPVTRLGQILFG